jgi:uncharacterized protein (TIGR03435 family)
MKIQACRALAIALAAGAVVALTAQSPEPTFDVVSIKRNLGSFPVGPEARQGGSFVATFASLETLVRFVYDVPSYRIVGGADWVRRDRFDVEARAGRDASADDIKRMVVAMLKDRFRLVVRQEKREGPIYALVMARSDKRPGPNLRPSVADCAAPGNRGEAMEERRTPNGGVSTQRTCAPMSVLVSSLSDALEAPVEDKTTLTGLWESDLSYTGDRRRSATPQAVAQDPNEAPALLTAVQEQLGLKLESGRGPVDVVVIESAAQPTEN